MGNNSPALSHTHTHNAVIVTRLSSKDAGMHMCTCPRSNLEKKGSIAPKNALLRKHTFGKQRYTLKKRRRKKHFKPRETNS